MRPATKPMGWVRYWPGTPLLGLVRASVSAELAHRRLADYHWVTGQWVTEAPAEGAALVRVAEAAWAQVVTELQGLGWRWRKGQLIHPEVAETRLEAVRFLRKKQAGGRIGGKRRGRKGQATPAQPAGDAQAALKQCSSDAQAMLEATPEQPASKAQAIHDTNDTDSTDSTDIKRCNAERLTRSVAAPSKRREGETEFRGEVAEVCELWQKGSSRLELENWGGWWRNRYRENPDKARRILAEVASMLREGRILKNPGAAALDLWGRLP